MLLCVYNDVGLPIMVRSTGSIKQPALAMQGLLYALQTSAQKSVASIRYIDTDSYKMVYKECFDSMLAVLISDQNDVTPTAMLRLLEYLFDAFVLTLGIQTMKQSASRDKLSKQLKTSVHILDEIMMQDNRQIPALEAVPAVLLHNDQSSSISGALTAFRDSLNTKEALGVCVFVGKEVLAATSPWWNRLTTREINLISLRVSSMAPATCRDIPVYLPYFSPNSSTKPGTIPLRMLTFQLTKDLEIVIVCGRDVSMQRVEEELIKNKFKSLLTWMEVYSAGEAAQPEIDDGILGFILVKNGRYCSCFYDKGNLSLPVQRTLLFSFMETSTSTPSFSSNEKFHNLPSSP
ncbi:hypothetical protein PROFUN_05944 [Planoprotostelium fungivorum]|uniref:FUZ/MON1/HPS1 first Longin domain-containing protein n=1 Tax=Planoprotostelium fungivorum TaxID=1890364 RepID=A0A2P6N7N8_9EUKA|nr:hypothetical protein PROFUN_05944 [Planoprotostelium fungivorum]